MSRYTRLIASALLCGFLSSCTNMKPVNDDDNELRVKTAKVNMQLGIAYLERHNIQHSKQKLLLALDEAPEIPEPWYAMGYFLETTGNKTDARTYYLRAIEIAPTRGDVQNNYGTFLCRSGDYQTAIQHFMLAIKDKNYLDPADAYENAGMCALKMPNYRLARQYFTRALSEDPTRPSALIGLAELDYQIGNYKAASHQISAFLLMSPATEQSNSLSTRIEAKLAALNPIRTPATPPVAIAIADPEPPRPVARVTYTQLLKQAVAKKVNLVKKHSSSNKLIVMNAIKKLPVTKKKSTLAAKKGKIVRV